MQYYREEPVLTTARAIDCFPSSVFFAFKEKKEVKLAMIAQKMLK